MVSHRTNDKLKLYALSLLNPSRSPALNFHLHGDGGSSVVEVWDLENNFPTKVAFLIMRNSVDVIYLPENIKILLPGKTKRLVESMANVLLVVQAVCGHAISGEAPTPLLCAHKLNGLM